MELSCLGQRIKAALSSYHGSTFESPANKSKLVNEDDALLAKLWAADKGLRNVSAKEMQRALAISRDFRICTKSGMQTSFQQVLSDLAEHLTIMEEVLINMNEGSPTEMIAEKAEEQEAPQTARILQQAFSLPYAIQKRSFRIQLSNLVQSTAELFNEAGDILLMLVLYR